MKKLLMIAYYFPPINSSGVYRTLGFIKYLPKKIWEISVLTVDIDATDTVDNDLFKKIEDGVIVYRSKDIDYFFIWKKLKILRSARKESSSDEPDKSSDYTSRCWDNIKKQISGLLKTPDNQSGWLFPALFQCRVLPRPDIIYSTAPPFTGLLIAAFLKKIWRIPLVIDFRDPWSDNPFNVKREGLVLWLNNLLERFTMVQADAIVSNTGPMAAHFYNKYPEINNKIYVINNGYDQEDYINVNPVRSVDKNTLLMVHIGLLYEQRNPIPFLEAVKKLRAYLFFDNQVVVQLIGMSETFGGQTLEELVRQLELTDIVDIVPPVSHQEALGRAKGADILLLFAQGTNMQIPAKLFEYLALGPPILAVCEEGSATQEMLADNKIHQIAKNNHVADIEVCIRNLYADWQQKGKKCCLQEKPLPEHLSYQYLANKLDTILQSLTRAD